MAALAGGKPNAIDTPIGHTIVGAARSSFTASMGRGFFAAALIALLGAAIALAFLPARAKETDLAEFEPSEAEVATTLLGGAEAEFALHATDASHAARSTHMTGAYDVTAELEPVGG